MKKNYTKLFLALLTATTMSFAQQTVMMDIGDVFVDLQTGGNYNDMVDQPNGANTIADLINDTGASTGFGFTTHANFEWFNVVGAGSTDFPAGPMGDAAIFEINTTRDSFFGSDNVPTGGFTFSGLDDTKMYTFEVFASRMGVTDNRDTEYTVAGSNTVSGNLNTAGNDSNTVVIANVSPNAGVITFDVNKGAANDNGGGYYYLGGIKMDESAGTNSIEDDIIANGGLQVYPNPVSDILNINYILNDSTESTVLIYDITGRLIYNASNQLNQAGTYSYKWNRLDNNGQRVVSGVYFLNFKTNNNSVTKKLVLR